MPLVQAKCTNCGANLQVDSAKDAAVCTYCGTPFIVEKAINNYNVTNNIRANVVNVYGGNGADFVIRGGVLERYNGASTEVVIPISVTDIGKDAFNNCLGITSVTIPNSVSSIGDCAFKGCRNLTYITIPQNATYIGEHAFDGCSKLNVPIVIPNGVTCINKNSFFGCNRITEVVIPNGVTKIWWSAFEGCSSLSTITIPQSVKEIGYRAFAECSSLKVLKIEGMTEVPFPRWDDDGDYNFGAFFNCLNLKTVIASDAWKRTYGFGVDCLYAEWCRQENIEREERRKKENGCYVATAIYGSYDCPQVWTLRRYRDYRLAETWYGRLFIRTYYAVSPTLVKWFGKTSWFQSFFRRKLDRMVWRLREEGIEDSPYEDRTW